MYIFTIGSPVCSRPLSAARVRIAAMRYLLFIYLHCTDSWWLLTRYCQQPTARLASPRILYVRNPFRSMFGSMNQGSCSEALLPTLYRLPWWLSVEWKSWLYSWARWTKADIKSKFFNFSICTDKSMNTLTQSDIPIGVFQSACIRSRTRGSRLNPWMSRPLYKI